MKTTLLLIVAMISANAIMTARADGFIKHSTSQSKTKTPNATAARSGQLHTQ